MIIGWFTTIVFIFGFILGVAVTNFLRRSSDGISFEDLATNPLVATRNIIPLAIGKKDEEVKGACTSTYVPMGTSKGEAICRRALEARYPGFEFPRVRPDILKNPNTGRNLEYDCYNEELGIAVEYNGRQHYEWVKKFQPTREDFTKQKERDDLKIRLSEAANIHLIIIPYKIPHNKIPETIHRNLPKD